MYVADVGANRVDVFAPGGPRDVLTVARSGSGLGSVSSVPVGVIACPSLCSTGFPEGEVVTLTATAPEHSSFIGWSGGGCAGTGVCQIALTAPTAVTAMFAHATPVLSMLPVSTVTRHTATVRGEVDPEGDSSSCRFEYGPTNGYGAEVPCASHPGSGASIVTVSAELWDLAAGTTYHYRLVSANSGGTAYGSDETFTTESEGCANNTALCPPQPVETSLANEGLVFLKKSFPGPTTRTLTNAQKLVKALKACKRQKKKSIRVSCEKQAKKNTRQRRRKRNLDGLRFDPTRHPTGDRHRISASLSRIVRVDALVLRCHRSGSQCSAYRGRALCSLTYDECSGRPIQASKEAN